MLALDASRSALRESELEVPQSMTCWFLVHTAVACGRLSVLRSLTSPFSHIRQIIAERIYCCLRWNLVFSTVSAGRSSKSVMS